MTWKGNLGRAVQDEFRDAQRRGRGDYRRASDERTERPKEQPAPLTTEEPTRIRRRLVRK